MFKKFKTSFKKKKKNDCMQYDNVISQLFCCNPSFQLGWEKKRELGLGARLRHEMSQKQVKWNW
jgi:hypothetical protein